MLIPSQAIIWEDDPQWMRSDNNYSQQCRVVLSMVSWLRQAVELILILRAHAWKFPLVSAVPRKTAQHLPGLCFAQNVPLYQGRRRDSPSEPSPSKERSKIEQEQLYLDQHVSGHPVYLCVPLTLSMA